MSPLMEGPCDEAQKRLIMSDINETDDDKIEHNREVLRAWIRTQPHLPQNYDDRLITRFIRGCKHNMEVSKKKLDTYFSIRNSQPEFFLHRDPHSKEVQTVLDTTMIAPFPILSPDGCRIVYHKISSDAETFNPAALFKTILMISDIRLHEESLFRGDIFVWDLESLSVKHLAKLATPHTKKVLMASQEAFPQRLQQIHLVNCSQLSEKLTSLFKMFMKPKMRNRWFVHSNPSSLTKHIPLELIPKELGGNAMSLHEISESWKQKLYDYSDWFEQQEKISTDESKRPADGKENNEYSNEQIKGTFRQISFD
ncbi:hypothetical protein M8J77_022986 [Diaphorina citri]|nr:hypothetical protein M8J77_022986 [Diaphorina citri]